MNDFYCRSCQSWKDKSEFARRINGDGLRDKCMTCEETKFTDKKWCKYHNDYFPIEHFRRRNYGDGRIGYDECKEMANARDRAKRRLNRMRDKNMIDNPVQQLLCCKW